MAATPPIRAVIDVGTNSVKLLVAALDPTGPRPLLERSVQTRLGRGFYDSGRLQPDAIRHTARTIADFANQARPFHPSSIRVVATSAARDAANPEHLRQAVQAAASLPVEIISGAQEAEWVFQGVMTDPGLRGKEALVIDLGGGSTEFILGSAQTIAYRQSFPLGTVRTLEQLRPSDPPTSPEWEQCQAVLESFLKQQLDPSLGPALASLNLANLCVVGAGGTATLLAAIHLRLEKFDPLLVDGRTLSLAEIRSARQRLWNLNLAERRLVPGLPPQRADVILTGSAIFETLLGHLGFAEMRISTRGLRYAAVLAPPAPP